jgi:hypothetical protein
MKITSDITNKLSGLALNSLSARFSSWFVTITDYFGHYKQKGGRHRNIAILQFNTTKNAK